MSSANDSQSSKLNVEESIEGNKLNFSSSSYTFKNLVSQTNHNNMKTKEVHSTYGRSGMPSIAYRNDGSSFDVNSTGSSSGTEDNSELHLAKSNYRIMFLGAKNTGKTSIVQQFLYDKFSDGYTETVDDMYRGEFDIYGKTISFDIQDVSGGYVYEFPAMRTVSLASADAFILVFSMDSFESWQEVDKLRDMIREDKGDDIPIVVVGNKTDLMTSSVDNRIPLESLEATVTFDWENGYVESSAKNRINIDKIFKELLQQSKAKYYFDVPPTPSGRRGSINQIHLFRSSNFVNRSTLKNSSTTGPTGQNFKGLSGTNPQPHDFLKRRQSLPVVCPAKVLSQIAENSENRGSHPLVPNTSRKKGKLLRKTSAIQSAIVSEDQDTLSSKKIDTNRGGNFKVDRRASIAELRSESCKIS